MFSCRTLPPPPPRSVDHLSGYRLEYKLSRPNPEELERRSDAYIIAYEARKRQKEERMAAMLNLPDEDGFITVRRVHKKRGNTDGKVTVKAIRSEQAARLAPTGGKGKDALDFYRFQHREAKRESKCCPSPPLPLRRVCTRAYTRLTEQTVFTDVELLELRRKFEEDKARIAAMRANRRFKPY